jgi:hypothetical protein
VAGPSDSLRHGTQTAEIASDLSNGMSTALRAQIEQKVLMIIGYARTSTADQNDGLLLKRAT